MNNKMKKIFALMLCVGVLWSMQVHVKAVSDVPLKAKFTYGSGQEVPPEYYNSMKYQYYTYVLKSYEEKGYKVANSQTITIDEKSIKVPKGKNIRLEAGINGRKDPAFIWDKEMPWAEWNFDVSSEGLYEIELEYYMPPGSGNSAVRSIYIDGQVPFYESNNIKFNRMWHDKAEPVVNSIGDEVRPSQVEISGWRSTKLYDSSGFYSEPFKFYFKPGKHVVRLGYVDQTIIVGKFYIKPAETLPAYDEIKKQYKANGYKEGTKTVKIQAEKAVIEKSDPTIRRESNGDPSCEPASSINRKLNVIGDWRWRRGNQSITWKITVPEDGLYKIALRAGQWWKDGLSSFRQIAIDGKVPFKEMEEYEFVYNKNWRTEVLKDSSDNPYLFYLTKGDHAITMTAKMSYLAQIAQSINDDSLLLSNIIRDIIKITGDTPDPNYDYEFMEKIPNLRKDMETLTKNLQWKYDFLKEKSQKLPAMANNFTTIISQIKDMLKDPFTIAKRMNDLNSAQTSLSSWYLSLQDQPLVIDYFIIGAPEEKITNSGSNIFQKLRATFDTFLVSFKKDYDNVGSILDKKTKVNSVIDIWIARGTEWAELIKEMTDEDFTPETGIAINVNVLPSSQLNAGSVNALMLSIMSGKAPDVALGSASNSPVEFAIRDTVYDLSKFKDFKEVSKRFLPNIFIPYEYNGGIYALPETMDFTVMFYRKDIVSDLGIKLPNTREELYDHVLPVLYQNGLEFYYPVDFSQFIFQHGGSFYTMDKKKTGLDTPEAYMAFKECSELYTNYAIPIVANFYNRFRTGEMPMGIGNYGLYLQLSVAAPELAGRWGIALLPGIKKADGTIDRSNGGLAGQCDMIMKQSKHPEESWKFLDWWTSNTVQTRFAREIEATIGTEARWNTANMEAFENLSWNKEDIEVIEEQLKWAKETPNVLGGYFTGRHINNAWNRIVINGEPVRDSIEQAVEDINREMKMKQEEYGVSDNAK
ncbi:MAG: extracellular solute-binding protein [Clostridiales bacterium]|nr:extracellular solute-binding protein [Clostridiales bacterium]